MERAHPGIDLDYLRIKREIRNNSELLWEENERLTELARDIARSGSLSIEGKRATYTEGQEETYREWPHIYKGTYFVPLDFNRTISLRELEAEGPSGEIKVALKLMVADLEPEIVATFSERKPIILEQPGYLTNNELRALRGLLEIIAASEEK